MGPLLCVVFTNYSIAEYSFKQTQYKQFGRKRKIRLKLEEPGIRDKKAKSSSVTAESQLGLKLKTQQC